MDTAITNAVETIGNAVVDKMNNVLGSVVAVVVTVAVVFALFWAARSVKYAAGDEPPLENL